MDECTPAEPRRRWVPVGRSIRHVAAPFLVLLLSSATSGSAAAMSEVRQTAVANALFEGGIGRQVAWAQAAPVEEQPPPPPDPAQAPAVPPPDLSPVPPVPAVPRVVVEAPASRPAPPSEPIAPALLTFSFGLGAAGSSGSVGGHLGGTSDWWERGPMLLVYLDGGLRVTPHLALVLYVDVAVGEASRSIRSTCEAGNLECGVAAGRVGIQARYAFTPAARTTTWLAVGTGWEMTDLTLDKPGADSLDSSKSQTVSFEGWEILKLGAGIDWRLSRIVGLGLFAYGSVGTFSSVTSEGPDYLVPGDLGSRGAHFWFLAGARITLFP
jgi:hypothetical protein